MGFEASRDSMARPGGGDTYKEAVPGGFNPTYASTDKLSEQDYRTPDHKGGPGRPNITPPPSVQMQPEDQRPGFTIAPPGHGPGHK